MRTRLRSCWIALAVPMLAAQAVVGCAPRGASLGAQPHSVDGVLTTTVKSVPYTASEMEGLGPLIEACERLGMARCRHRAVPGERQSRFTKGVDRQVFAMFHAQPLTPGAAYDVTCQILDPSGNTDWTINRQAIVPRNAPPDLALTLHCGKALRAEDPTGRWAIQFLVNGRVASSLRFEIVDAPAAGTEV